MKVSDHNTTIQLGAYIKQVQQQYQPNGSKTKAQTRMETADKVELSDQAKQIQQIARKMNNVSDVREDKVRQVKMEVENSTYKVVGAKVATAMLNEAIENNVILQKISTKA